MCVLYKMNIYIYNIEIITKIFIADMNIERIILNEIDKTKLSTYLVIYQVCLVYI